MISITSLTRPRQVCTQVALNTQYIRIHACAQIHTHVQIFYLGVKKGIDKAKEVRRLSQQALDRAHTWHLTRPNYGPMRVHAATCVCDR